MMPRKPAIPSPEAGLALAIGEIVAVGMGEAIATLGISVGVGDPVEEGWSAAATPANEVGTATNVAVACATTEATVAAGVDTPAACALGVGVTGGGARVAGARVAGGGVTITRVGADGVGADGVGAAWGAQIWANVTGGKRTEAASALTTSQTQPSI